MKHSTSQAAPALALLLALLPAGGAWAQGFNSVSSGGAPLPATGSALAGAPATMAGARAPAGNFDVADKVVVAKGERRLYLLRENQVIAEYPVHLGLNPYGPKQREGDFRTPEGSYRLVRRNPRSAIGIGEMRHQRNRRDPAACFKPAIGGTGLLRSGKTQSIQSGVQFEQYRDLR
jgi:hypothetical protein